MAPQPFPFFFLSEETRLSREASRHFLTVLRLGTGDCLEVSDGRGQIWLAEAVSVEGKQIRVRYLEARNIDSDPPRLCLATAIPKGQRMGVLVEKAGELGVREIRPIITQRSSVRTVTEGMIRRWGAIAESARAQSRYPWVCPIHPPISLEKLLSSEIQPAYLDMGDTFTSWSCLVSNPSPILLIGPEGGWSDHEYQLFQERGLLRLSMGTRPLRMETAAMTAVTWYEAAKAFSR
ncbi:MAG TPA: RsmE family RNA methyltransferase [Thermoanaerobaculia bacterium]|nr:RsmE family RNA methyltransferase [Thermoanaerobaculia bacterium]HUM29400.1 RsmE family RNA methyltransferase [Thermoanaerobaculia bacterium]HXK67646.1 RsmE family RNA methyltransferase [Thermoanaerobaculia bacterium]